MDNLLNSDFTTPSDYVAEVKRLHTFHYSVDFILLSFRIIDSIVDFDTIRGSLMGPKWS